MDWSDYLVGAAGSATNGLFSALGSGIQYRHQKRLMQKQFDLNKQMWDLQNAYNTPSAQRQRMEEAGLNPYLLNGSVSNTASSMQGVEQPSAPNLLNGFDFQRGIQLALQRDLNAAQVKYYDSMSDLNSAKAENERDRNPYVNGMVFSQKLQQEAQRLKNLYYAPWIQSQIDKATQSIEQSAAQIQRWSVQNKLTDVQIERARYEIDNILPKLMEKYDADIAKSIASISLMAIQGEYQQGMLRLYQSGELGGSDLQILMRVIDQFVDDISNGTSKSPIMKIYNLIKGQVQEKREGVQKLERAAHESFSRFGRSQR